MNKPERKKNTEEKNLREMGTQNLVLRNDNFSNRCLLIYVGAVIEINREVLVYLGGV